MIGSVFSGLFEGNFLGASSSKTPSNANMGGDTPKVLNVEAEFGDLQPVRPRNNEDNDSVTRI